MRRQQDVLDQRGTPASCDTWMQTLFGADITAVDFAWMMAHIARCEAQIWEVAAQLVGLGIDVVLDRGSARRSTAPSPG